MDNDYVDRSSAINTLRDEINWHQYHSTETANEDFLRGLSYAADMLKGLPEIEVSEQLRARWDFSTPSSDASRFTCSNCDFYIDTDRYSDLYYNYCPMCGAKMRG